MAVEHVFDVLKERFRRLVHFTEHRNINFVVNLVICPCILHNICIDQNDEFDETVDEMDSDDEEDESGTDDDDVQDRRQELFYQMVALNML